MWEGGEPDFTDPSLGGRLLAAVWEMDPDAIVEPEMHRGLIVVFCFGGPYQEGETLAEACAKVLLYYWEHGLHLYNGQVWAKKVS